MMERKSLMSLLLGLSLCTCLWHIMLQQTQSQFIDSAPPYNALNLDNESILTLSSSLITTTENISEHSLLQLEGLPKNDFSHLIDLDDFEFIKNPRACKELDQKPVVVIMVHSAPDNFQKRVVIRETWGMKDPRALLLFLIGAVNSTNIQDKLDLENKVNEDLVQGNFQDAYRNMTYKHVMALKWFLYNCPESRYLLKTDDDVFVNTPRLYEYLVTPSALNRQQFYGGRLLMCYEIARAKVKRTYRSKWRVSYDEYFEKYYPNHCPGFSILYSPDVVQQLYLKAQQLKYFWIDDVHITGNVASKLNITIAPTDGLFLSKTQQNDLLKGHIRVESTTFLFARPNLEEKEIRTLWKLVR